MGIKIVAVNRKARHNYFLEEFFEAGLVLVGTEIKSIKNGNVQMKDAYISIINGEAFVKAMNISIYKEGNQFNHDEQRERKLLLNKKEIIKLQRKMNVEGYTIIPTKIYLSNGRAKIEIALAKGKKLYDKRQSEKERDIKRMLQQTTKKYV